MLLVAIMSAKAQDILTLTDNSVLKVKVLEITPTEIKYKKFDNINGPTYTSLISGVKSIIYENGTTETFNNPNPVQSEPAVSPILNSTSPQQDLSVSDRQLLIMDQYHGQDMNWQKYQKRGKSVCGSFGRSRGDKRCGNHIAGRQGGAAVCRFFW